MDVSAEVLEVLEFDRIKRSVASRAASVLGRKVAGRMRPIEQPSQVQRCLRETSEMVRILRARERFPLSGLADIEGQMEKAKAKGQPLEPEDLRDFATTFETAGEIRGVLQSFGPEVPTLQSLTSSLSDFGEIRRQIGQTIDPQGKVRDDATEKLMAIRAEIRGLTTQIHQRLEKVLETPKISKFLQDRRIALRGGRFVLAVKSGARGQVEGILHDRSQTGATIYVEPKEIVELGNTLTEAFVEEAREISSILWAIARQVFDREEEVVRTLRAVEWIDFTYAKARLSIEYEMEEPVLGEDLDLRSLRHPILLEILGKDAVVPVTVRLGKDEKAMVITGPNAGGKTVALKTVGISVVMTHAGLHLPCEKGTSVPSYASLFADIGDEQSLETSLSTFSSHMVRLVEILEKAGPGSLVLIDELGSGTDPAEGGALGEAILAHLIQADARVLVSTHLGALKQFAFTHPGAVNAAVEFDPETLQPLFRIAMGAPGNSHALAIARRLGIPKEVAHAAAKLMEGESDIGKELISRIQEVRLEAESARDGARKLEEEARKKERRARDLVKENQALKRAITREADEEMESSFREVRKRVRDYEKEMAGAPEKHQERAQALRASVDEALSHTPYGQKRRAFAATLKKGKRVFLIKFGREGEVTRVFKNKERLSVRLGKIVVETGFDDVSWVDERGKPVAP